MGKNILLVDDEPMVSEELQEALEFEGFDVTAVESVSSALMTCDEASFDLIITDLKMPHLGGLDLLCSLQEMSDPPKVFVLSGHGAESNRAEAISLGAAECFAKPVDPDMLISRINAALI